jgi:hypothetical protein
MIVFADQEVQRRDDQEVQRAGLRYQASAGAHKDTSHVTHGLFSPA